MDELQTVLLCGLNGRVGDEFKINNRYINITTIFSSLP